MTPDRQPLDASVLNAYAEALAVLKEARTMMAHANECGIFTNQPGYIVPEACDCITGKVDALLAAPPRGDVTPDGGGRDE